MLERELTVPVVYSVVENDSVDCTPQHLQAWLQNRPGCWISERCGAPSLRKGQSSERTQALAARRNLALDRLLQFPFDVVLVIDGGLEITPRQPLRILHQLLRNPAAAMVAAAAIQNVPDVFGEEVWSHYDSWAFRDLQGRGGITFAAIPLWDGRERERWRAGLPVAVASAFGGMAAVRRSLLEVSGARWEGSRGCEHWAFCADLRRCGPVLVDPLVQPLVRHVNPPQWSAAYAQRVRAGLGRWPGAGPHALLR